MPGKGSCFCGHAIFEYSGEPVMKAICHCLSCRKISGSTYTTNVLVPTTDFNLTSGDLKSFTAKHENGMDITRHFCADCGTCLYKTASADVFAGLAIVQAGLLDDADPMQMAEPQAELWTKYRASWMGEVKGGLAKQCQTFE